MLDINYYQTYGGLVPVKPFGVAKGHKMSICKCLLCDKEVSRRNSAILRKPTSCGCKRITHGLSGSRIHIIWTGMLGRCTNKNNVSFKDYGGRGIKVEWKNFEEFYKDMSKSYFPDASIERINVNGNYSKKNCKWISLKSQNLNKRNSFMVIYKGTKVSLKLLCLEKGLPYKQVWRRIREWGWDIESAIEVPFNKKGSKYGAWQITLSNESENFSHTQTLLDEEIPCLIEAFNKIQSKRHEK